MKELEQKADLLIEQFKAIEIVNYGCKNDGNPCIIVGNMLQNGAIKCAIQSVNYTIELLENRKKDQNFVICIILNEAINEQIELKKILEGRL
jgi:hypothetical protein